MNETSSAEVQREALRVQRLLEETLDRHAGRSEGERVDALVEAIRSELAALPSSADRRALVAELRGVVGGSEPTGSGAAPADPALLAEIDRLRAALAEREAGGVARPAATGDFAAAAARLLLGA